MHFVFFCLVLFYFCVYFHIRHPHGLKAQCFLQKKKAARAAVTRRLRHLR